MSIKKALLLLLLLFLLTFFNLTAFGQKEAAAESLPTSETAVTRTIADQPQARQELMLGTVCKVKIYDYPDSVTFENAFARIEKIENQMSITIADSFISAVNDEAGSAAVIVPEETFQVIAEAVKVAGISSGAFDPTVGPLVKAWGIGTDNARVPSQEEIAALLPLIDYRQLELNEKDSSVFLKKPGMVLDLGGIAKGFAADEVRTVLRDSGVESAIINLGGNVLTVGAKPDGSPWKIGIQNPDKDRGTYVMILTLVDTAIVTSGPYERYFTVDDQVYHHILDTETGYPVSSDIGSVSIIAPDSFLADALSTAFYSLGVVKGMDLIESLEGIEAVVFLWDNSIILSSGMENGEIEYQVTDDSFSVITRVAYLNSLQ